MATLAETTTTRNPQPIAWYAYFEKEPGIVLKTRTGAVWFIAEDTKVRTLLHPCDWVDLERNGNVALTLRQQRADGDMLALVMRKNTHAPKAA